MKFLIAFAGPGVIGRMEVIDASSQTEAELIAQAKSRAAGIEEEAIGDWSWARPATDDVMWEYDMLPSYEREYEWEAMP